MRMPFFDCLLNFVFFKDTLGCGLRLVESPWLDTSLEKFVQFSSRAARGGSIGFSQIKGAF